MKIASRLSPEEFHILAEEALFNIIQSLLTGKEPFIYSGEGPFREEVEERFIIGDVCAFMLEERIFRAVSRAADAVGDHFLLYSVVRALEGGVENNTWKVPLFDYEGYEMPTLDRGARGIPLEQVLYSPSGEWAIISDDDFALVGGSLKFATYLRHEYPEWREGLVEFLDKFRVAAQKPNVDVSWVQPLLRHLYGDGAPEFEV